MTMLTATNKRDARRRYNAGEFIAVGYIRHVSGHHGQAFTRDAMDNMTFDELVQFTLECKRGPALYWFRPATTCAPRVDRETARYPYRPACACGWRHPWGYVAEHAARDLADAHVAGQL